MSRAIAQHYRAGDNRQLIAGSDGARIRDIGQTLHELFYCDKKISLELDAASEVKISRQVSAFEKDRDRLIPVRRQM